MFVDYFYLHWQLFVMVSVSPPELSPWIPFPFSSAALALTDRTDLHVASIAKQEASHRSDLNSL